MARKIGTQRKNGKTVDITVEDNVKTVSANVDADERSRKEKAKSRFGAAGVEAVQRDIAAEREAQALGTPEGQLNAANVNLQNQANEAIAKTQAENAAFDARVREDPALATSLQELGNVPAQQATTGGQIVEPDAFNVLPGVAGGAAGVTAAASTTGAALGLATLPAIVPAAVGAGAAILAKVTFDERQKVKEFNKRTSEAPDRFNAIIEGVNKGTLDPKEAIRLFNEQKKEILINQANLKAEVMNSITKSLGTPGDELEAVNTFVDFQLGNYEADLLASIKAPNPTRQFSYTTEVIT